MNNLLNLFLGLSIFLLWCDFAAFRRRVRHSMILTHQTNMRLIDEIEELKKPRKANIQ